MLAQSVLASSSQTPGINYQIGGGFVMPLDAMLGDEPDYFGDS
jgi:hypothetical protein